MEKKLDKLFNCSLCGKSFRFNKNLFAHKRNIHNIEPDVANTSCTRERNFECKFCASKFTRNSSVLRHIAKFHAQASTALADHMYSERSSKKSRLICPLHDCDEDFKTYLSLRQHLGEFHNQDVELEELEFDSLNEFENWKSQMEQKTASTYIPDSAYKVLANGDKKQYYNCHRSYNFCSKSQNKRAMKSMGTNKINKACPSRIEMVVCARDGNCKITMKFWKTHCGHSSQIGRKALDKKTRSEIAGKLAEGVTFEKILDSIRDAQENNENKRLSLLERKDMHNIVRDFNIDYATKRHSNDAISIKLWVEEMKALGDECPVLYFKGQNEEDSQLQAEDFALVIMTSFQAQQLSKFGKFKVCIDGTHGTNAYDIQLYTLMTIDEFGSGCPVAFLFSNRSDQEIFNLFFETIKSKVGIVKPSVFMSDDAPAFYNGWSKVMGAVPHRLLCTLHVDRNWRQNLTKIRNLEKRALVYKTLRTLLQVLSIEDFHNMQEQVLQDLLSDDDTKPYGLYFLKYYYSRPRCWAYCYRTGLGINTNMYLEAFHKILKHIYLDGKKVRRLDKSINAVMKLARDSYFKRLIKLSKNTPSDKQMKINQSHKSSDQIRRNQIKVLKENNEWAVRSSTNAVLEYHVEKVQETCPGLCLKCVYCHICIHTLRCSCTDNVIKLNICKHIHACVRESIVLITEERSYVLEDEAKFRETAELLEIKNSPNVRNSTDSTQIRNKIQLLLNLTTDINLNPECAKQVEKKLDDIIEILNKSIHMEPTKKINVQANVARQPRLRIQKKGMKYNNHKNCLFSTKKKPVTQNNFQKPSINEENSIKEGLLGCGESVHIHNTFDHSYI